MMDNKVPQEKTKEFQLDLAKYEAVSSAARLREIKLISSSYQVLPQAFVLSDDDEKVKKLFSGKVVEFSFDQEEGIAWGKIEWRAEVKLAKKSVIKLVADYLLVYSEIVDCDAEHCAFYFKKVGRFATYPYFRGLYSHHMGESGLVAAPLPTLSERVD